MEFQKEKEFQEDTKEIQTEVYEGLSQTTQSDAKDPKKGQGT